MTETAAHEVHQPQVCACCHQPYGWQQSLSENRESSRYLRLLKATGEKLPVLLALLFLLIFNGLVVLVTSVETIAVVGLSAEQSCSVSEKLTNQGAPQAPIDDGTLTQ